MPSNPPSDKDERFEDAEYRKVTIGFLINFPKNQGDAILVEVQEEKRSIQGGAIIPVSSLHDNPNDRIKWWPIYYEDNKCIGKVQLSIRSTIASDETTQGVLIVYDYELNIGWGKSISLTAPPPGQMTIRSSSGPPVTSVPSQNSELVEKNHFAVKNQFRRACSAKPPHFAEPFRRAPSAKSSFCSAKLIFFLTDVLCEMGRFRRACSAKLIFYCEMIFSAKCIYDNAISQSTLCEIEFSL
ncbi:hypothetical protein LXL04_032208 [Taraxacum kok-saghyz]